jgi:hypothetical protein
MNISGININGVAIGDTISSGLYAFTTFTFQTAGVVGPTGPSLGQFYSSYSNVGNTWLQNTSYFNVTTPGYQKWTVPATGSYRIEVAGSRGGISNYTGNTSANVLHGRGAIVSGTIGLTKGQILTIAVGQHGANAASQSAFSIAGSGGGSFVVANTTPLIIAGGGSSAGMWTGNGGIVHPGSNGVTTNAGSNSKNGAPGGTGGNGGNSHVNAAGTVSMNGYDGGGGGGFYSNGVNGGGGNVRTNATNGSTGGGGQGFQANLVGGVVSSSYTTYDTAGGFGGGGGPGAISSGGGGGYSGGGGGYNSISTGQDAGGGGGSYIDPSATSVATSDGNYNSSNTFNGVTISNIGSYNNAPGYVRITKL